MADAEEEFFQIWKNFVLNESLSASERARRYFVDCPIPDKYSNMWRYMETCGLPESMEEGVERVLSSKDGLALIGDATELRYAEMTNCNLQTVGQEFWKKPYAVAVQEGHPLKDHISSEILSLQGRLFDLKQKWWYENPKKIVCPIDSTYDSDLEYLSNIALIMIFIGISFCILTLTAEYFYFRRQDINEQQASLIFSNEEREEEDK
ncbi:hypothetical protein PMAYCL1PPCAC_32293 [Pristionchus mayeri]|uniref:Ionotropic glutamate receptor C-terminal domain-containing protein n=1 Tax=Pristionchus mayeri TaxID=1317129 RepID=A0AAN5IDB6_9BILA|nr:hypothetical protein PMAYCL1PPCAC_32293 [Pristionchus mayeri]